MRNVRLSAAPGDCLHTNLYKTSIATPGVGRLIRSSTWSHGEFLGWTAQVFAKPNEMG